MEIRKSGEDYLEAILILERQSGAVRSIDLARHMSRAVDLVKKFGAVVVSPGYRLAFAAPYPAVLDDCHAALV